MPPEDDVLLAEEQPLPAALSPIANSPGYVADSDPEEDHEEDPEDDPADYPTNGDDDDDDDESSDDDKDDDDHHWGPGYASFAWEYGKPDGGKAPCKERDGSARGTVSPVEIHPINSSADEEGGTTVVGCDQNDASIRKEMQKRETVKSVGAKYTTRSIRKDSSSQDSQSKENVSVLPQAIKCRLWHLKKTTIIAEGTVYKSDGKIMLHNKALPKDCYKVSIDKSLVDAAFIPDVGSNGCTTVLDAVGGFVAWPKNQVVLDPKATPPSTIQMITGENKTAPKVQTKRKNVYVSSDAMQKEANKKRMDDVEEDEDEGEEEEEHLASADSEEVDRLLDISTTSPSPLTPLSLPLPHIPSPPLPVSPTHSLGYRAAMIRLRAESPSTSYPLPLPLPIVLPHTMASMAMMRAATPSTYILAPPLGTPPLLPIPLSTSSPPLLLPSTDCRANVLEVTLPPRKRLYIALGLRFEVGKSSSAPTTRPTEGFRADYGFVSTLDDEIRRVPERDVGYMINDTWDDTVEEMQGTSVATDVTSLSQRMSDFVTTIRHDTDEIYRRLDDAHDDRVLMSSQLNMLRRDRRTHARTFRLMEAEARLSHEA
ncbi:hypothetical protein Tco_0040437 [Tanacetum coccineum]